MTISVAIVGRPNVGKSTLFNRLVGKRRALIDNQPGVTRDFREEKARLGDLEFIVLDTAGMEPQPGGEMEQRIGDLTELALSRSDACIFMVDIRQGILPADHEVATVLRKSGKPIIYAANKCEGRFASDSQGEIYELGFDDPILLSAEHALGIGELYDQLKGTIESINEHGRDSPSKSPESSTVLDDDLMFPRDAMATVDKPLRVAIVGRPNAGKSSLINRILGEDRLLTGSEPGITRDAISVRLSWRGTNIQVFDTAGMRKRSKIVNRLEKLSVSDGIRAIMFAEVVVVLLDAQIPLESQDLHIASLAEREGRAVVVALNKWDLVDNRRNRFVELQSEFSSALPQLTGANLVAISAKTGHGLISLHQEMLRIHEIWNKRIPTARLNLWLGEMVDAHPPPAWRGKHVRLKYITQVSTRPPSFVVMCSKPGSMPVSYSRYLVNGMRRSFGLAGTPIRLSMRSRADKNPFAGSR